MTFKVLIVDDSKTIRFVVSQLLEKHDLETRQARNGQEALEVLVDDPAVDVVITDVHLLGLVSGEKLIELIQRQPAARRVPVIVLSTLATKDVQLRCLGLGASAFVSKPWDNELFVATVHTLARNFRGLHPVGAGAPIG
jgi:CheY-like chemotaxis protein